MSIFGAIRNAIFGPARPQAQPQPGQPQAQGEVGIGAQARPASPPGLGAGASAMPQMGGAQAQPPQAVDVEQVLVRIEQQKGGAQLNWRKSIVDLMKLLDLDASLDNRKALATELGYTGARDGSAEMNIWLHRKVMEELERNGGRVPAAMKD